MRKVKLIFLVGLALLVLAACGSERTEEKGLDPDKKIVYASFFPIYDLTSKLAGDKLEVRQLVPDGQEAHDFSPTSQDLVDLERASALVINGSEMEPWLEDVLASLENDPSLIDSSKGLASLDSSGEVTDPHTWLSPQKAKVQAKTIAEGLISLDPENKAYYQENYDQLEKEFDKLDKEFKEKTSKFSSKDLLVSHEAFAYLADNYGLRQLGLEALVPDSEPSPKKMAETIDFIRESQVQAIYQEKNSPSKPVESLEDETGVRVLELNTLEFISEEEKKAGDDYFSLMRENLDQLERGLN